MQTALELQGDALPPGQGRVGIDRTQGVVGDGQRLGIAHHASIVGDDGHVIGQEGAGVVVHRAQDGGGLAGVGLRRHQHSMPVEGDTSRMDEGIAFADKVPAQDGFDHIGIEHMRGETSGWVRPRLSTRSLFEIEISKP